MPELTFNALHYVPAQPDETPTDYIVWVEICKRMDREAAEARAEWRLAVKERDEVVRELKLKTDRLREKCVTLEARQKPAAPFRSNSEGL